MAGKELQFKHFFRVRSGKFTWEDPDMFEYIRRQFEGKRGYALFHEHKDDPSPNQYGYYFGGIIRKECMNSAAFSGWTEKEIHHCLLKEVIGIHKQIQLKDGSIKTVIAEPDFDSLGKDGMRDYISKLIPYLQIELDIHPKPAEDYRYNKYHIK